MGVAVRPWFPETVLGTAPVLGSGPRVRRGTGGVEVPDPAQGLGDLPVDRRPGAHGTPRRPFTGTTGPRLLSPTLPVQDGRSTRPSPSRWGPLRFLSPCPTPPSPHPGGKQVAPSSCQYLSGRKFRVEPTQLTHWNLGSVVERPDVEGVNVVKELSD